MSPECHVLPLITLTDLDLDPHTIQDQYFFIYIYIYICIYIKKCNENKAVEKHYSKIHYRPHGAPLN